MVLAMAALFTVKMAALTKAGMSPIRLLAFAAVALALAGCASQYAHLYPRPMANPRGEAAEGPYGRDGYGPPPACHRSWFRTRCAAT